jgi:uroporphyrinogen decarboxylase
MRGLENTMMDMALNQDFFQALLRKITDLMVEATDKFLDEVGDTIDVYLMGDDLGSQNAPLCSPQMYRDLVKNSHAELIAKVREKSKAKIFFHSCGNVYPLIGDLIDVGVDILNPVQVSAKDMGDTARLKREFGDKITFCGGIDTQTVLPKGTPEEVRAEVRHRIKDLASGGGYILAAVHCIQPDVPLENIEAMFDEAKKSGQYPINL